MFERTKAWLATQLLGKQFPLFTQTGETVLEGFFPSSGVTRRGTIELLNAHRHLPWLRVSTDKIGTEVASTVWRLFVRTNSAGRPVRDRQTRALQTGDYKFVHKNIMQGLTDGTLREIEFVHPLLELLLRGNSRLDGYACLLAHQLNMDLKGEMFWWLIRNNAGLPQEYFPLPSNWIRELPKSNFPFYEISFGGINETVPEEDMLWWKHPNPANPYGRGTGVGESLGDELDLDESATKFLKSFFRNDMTPPTLIGFEGASQSELERAKKKWEARHRGFSKAFRAHFFKGKLEVKQLSSSLKDAMMTDLRQQTRDTTHQVFGIPPEILGIIANSNRATIDAAHSIFARHVILPRLEFQRRGYQRHLVPMYDDRLIIWYDSPIPEDKEGMLAAATAQPASMEVNEWRELQGQDVIPELDGVFLVPAGVTATRLDEDEEPEPEPEMPEESETEEEVEPEPEEVEPEPRHAKPQRKDISAAEISRILRAVNSEVLIDAVDPIYRDMVRSIGELTLTDLGLAGSAFNMVNPAIVDFLADKSATTITNINDTTRSLLRELLSSEAAEGSSIDQIARSMRARFVQFDEVRSKTIAQTEVLSASNFASVEGMIQSELIDEKEWVATKDDRTRPDHLAFDGVKAKVNEDFNFAGLTAPYPGGFGIPEQDINCRCAVIPVVPDLERTPAHMALAWKVFENRRAPWDEKMQRALQEAFKEQRDAVLDVINSLG